MRLCPGWLERFHGEVEWSWGRKLFLEWSSIIPPAICMCLLLFYISKPSECNGHTAQLRGMASTLRMRTAISPGQWQPWTDVLSFLRTHQHGRARRKGLTEDHQPRRLLPRRVQKHSFKRQLHSVNVVAVDATVQDSLGNAYWVWITWINRDASVTT